MTKTQDNITYRRAKGSVPSQQVTTRLQDTDKTVWQRLTQNKERSTKDLQKKYRLGTVSKEITGGLKLVSRYQHHPKILGGTTNKEQTTT